MSLDARDLDAVRNEKLIHLTTVGRKTARPHTVELWFATADGKVYLSHEGARTDWMKNIEAEPRVSARIAKLKFEATARLARSDSIETGKMALYQKYYGPASKEIIDDWFSLSEVIQVNPS